MAEAQIASEALDLNRDPGFLRRSTHANAKFRYVAG
jgi:hypothetical protein